MLMNPTLTSTFQPIALEGIRHDLNRLYYNPEYLRSELMDQAYGYPTMPLSPYYAPLAFAPRAMHTLPYGRPYEAWTRPEFGFARGYEWPRAEYPRAEYPRAEYPRPEYPLAGYGRAYDPRMTEAFFGQSVRPLELAQVPGTEGGYQQSPVCNFAETQDAYLFVIELPGVDLKDISLQLHGATLVLTAFRRPTWSNGTVTVNYHLAEGRFGTLRRVLPLPAGILPGQIQANYINGMLTVLLPRTGASAGTLPQASIVINSAVPTTM